ncbi:MAG: hypothetical protein Fur0010_16960 [Bdellovibrio sp.]
MRQLITLFVVLFATFEASATLMETSLKFLASDALMGRKAGTIENQTATDYLGTEIKNLGLAPLGQSYFQEFTIFTRMVKYDANHFVVGGMNGEFEPIAFSESNDLIDAELVFAGFGISIPANDPKLQYDDYDGLDVKGKVVIVLTGDPGIGNSGSLFRDPAYLNYQSVNYKLSNAQSKGARGVIIVQDPLSITDLSREQAPYFNEQEGGGARFNVLAGMSTNRFMKNIGLDTLVLQKQIAATQMPASKVLGLKSNLSVHLKKETGRVKNVIGVIKGSDPVLSKEVIVLGAHFDHLGLGGQSSMEPNRSPKIHNGADDNASGTALVLHLASKLVNSNPKRTILIAFFNAEEDGLLGSKHFVQSWPQFEAEYGTLYAMLNFDMVGRFDKKVSLMGTGTAFEWGQILSPLATTIPMETTKLAVGSSDHYSFMEGKVPALFFTTGAHSDYHRASDDSDKIDFASMLKISSFAEVLVAKITGDEVITFDPDSLQGQDPGRNRGYGAHLGCVPMFGQPDTVIGVYCTRASPNSPAEAAGIVDGDIVVGIGDVEIKNIYDLVFALKYYRSGDVVELRFMRNNVLIKKTITLTTKTPNKSLWEKMSGGHFHSCHQPPIL